MSRRWIPFLTLVPVLLVIGSFFLPSHSDSFDLNQFGQIPVLHDGRVKPLDTVARAELLALRGKQSLSHSGTQYSPMQWLLEVAVHPEITDGMPLFVVRNSSVLGMLGQRTESKPFLTFKELLPFLDKIEQEADLATQTEPKDRNGYQREMISLKNNLVSYTRLKNTFKPEGVAHFEQYTARYMDRVPAARHQLEAHPADFIQTTESVEAVADIMVIFKQLHYISRAALFRTCPPLEAGTPWRTQGDGYLIMLKVPTPNPAAPLITTMIAAYETQNPQQFNMAVEEYRSLLDAQFSSPMHKVKFEHWINQSQIFYVALVLYLMVAITIFIGWLMESPLINRVAVWGLIWGFGIHTIAILSRMWILGRPPVTNLYTSAVFVGWVAIALGLILERVYKNGVGAMVSGVIGFSTLIIAHHLSLQGDTMEMMQAVLDSNFWLATHVVTICIGYGATFLAGFLALVYVLRGVFTRGLDSATRANIIRMIYAILCFALLFSLIGTVLGGIWADQSWGRFWGWDPKENGAMIIVLWNAAILHSRWGGLVRERGLIAMALFGNIVTSFSWFGVNMLGIGLHSYGFMDQAFLGLVAFVFSQLFLIWLAYLPPQFWRSNKG